MTREELERRLRLLYVAHQDSATFPHTASGCTWCDDRMENVMAVIDEFLAEYIPPRPVAVWTATEVAEFLGYKSTANARVWLSQRSIKSIGTVPNRRGRYCAVYPADRIREVRQEETGE